ncbi:LysR family transcriptional regulator [Vibrio taketomensis]|uniref:LysR family transcriptional regulator n=1 Tax=Vibrio taketomensis TaxID=2572923 RepID=UPI0022B2A23B|nr:LysR family transcriptional regulator [Vibrio taketomensis]
MRTFVVAVKHKNFSAAARELHTVQPTVSRHISELESKLGVKLFYRNTHLVELTPAGVLLYSEALKILENNSRVIDLVSQANSDRVSKMNIGYLATAASCFIPEIISDYSMQHPHVTTYLYEMSGQEQCTALMEKRVDVIFCRDQPLLNDQQFVRRQIYVDDLVAVVPSNHHLANKSELSIADLNKERFMMFHRAVWSNVFKHILDLCEQHGFTPQMSYYPDNMRHMATFVSSGLGVSIAPSCIKFLTNEHCVCRRIKELSYPMPLYMYYHKENTSVELDSFVKICEEHKVRIENMIGN